MHASSAAAAVACCHCSSVVITSSLAAVLGTMPLNQSVVDLDARVCELATPLPFLLATSAAVQARIMLLQKSDTPHPSPTRSSTDDGTFALQLVSLRAPASAFAAPAHASKANDRANATLQMLHAAEFSLVVSSPRRVRIGAVITFRDGPSGAHKYHWAPYVTLA